MSELTYDALIRELFPRLTAGIRWGLERTERMLAAVGNPHLAYRTVHVGGTNGKGSVAAMIEAGLRATGRSTGLYVSPHLCTFRERVQIDGRAISEDALVACARMLWPSIWAEQPSFFEATTAIGFLALAEAGVEDAVIEVGLGGRLDATNVVRPLVSVLTNVAFDHVQFLGPTLESIAREKAGIIKPGVPVVTGETGAAALAEFHARAASVGAPLHVIGPDRTDAVETSREGTRVRYRSERWGPVLLRTPLPGRHQAANMALAAAALEALPDGMAPDLAQVQAGLAALRWPGRLQIEAHQDRLWVFDVAHNLAGVEALTAALADVALPRPLVALVGVLGDKDWRAMLGPIAAASDAVILTRPPTAPVERSWDPASVLAETRLARTTVVGDFGDALHAAWQRTSGNGGGTILVTGSFHTVGDALIALGIPPFGADAGLPVPIFAV